VCAAGLLLGAERLEAAAAIFNGRLQCRQRTISERVDRWHERQ
jgi:hypothetical protein